MARRLADLLLATIGLVVAAPLLLVAAIAIRLSSPGPILYRARRIGRLGSPFIMLKLRTMHGAARPGWPRITGPADWRVFPAGRWLRAAKIDELPQLVNVLRGEMSIIGPRPEDPVIIRKFYTTLHLRTLGVHPGLASPGSLYHTTHGDQLLRGGDAEALYLARLLPVKLALDLVAMRRTGVFYDLGLMVRTCLTIVQRLAGRRDFPDPPELVEARSLIVPVRQERSVHLAAAEAR